eukprot:g25803.t1
MLPNNLFATFKQQSIPYLCFRHARLLEKRYSIADKLSAFPTSQNQPKMAANYAKQNKNKCLLPQKQEKRIPPNPQNIYHQIYPQILAKTRAPGCTVPFFATDLVPLNALYAILTCLRTLSTLDAKLVQYTYTYNVQVFVIGHP